MRTCLTAIESSFIRGLAWLTLVASALLAGCATPLRMDNTVQSFSSPVSTSKNPVLV